MNSTEEGYDRLLAGLGHHDPLRRVKAIRSWGACRGTVHAPTFELLLKAVDDQNKRVREQAVKSLGTYGEYSLRTMINLMNHPCKYVRRNLIWALGRLGPRAFCAVPALALALKDSDPRAAAAAAETLGAIGRDAADAVPALAEAMRGSNIVLCRVASKALGQIGAPALNTLLAHLDHHDSFVQGEAALALGWMNKFGQHAVPHLLRLLERVTATQSSLLKKAKPPEYSANSEAMTPQATIVASNPAQETLILQILQSLGRIGPDAYEARHMLRELAKCNNETISMAAKSALILMRPTTNQPSDY